VDGVGPWGPDLDGHARRKRSTLQSSRGHHPRHPGAHRDQWLVALVGPNSSGHRRPIRVLLGQGEAQAAQARLPGVSGDPRSDQHASAVGHDREVGHGPATPGLARPRVHGTLGDEHDKLGCPRPGQPQIGLDRIGGPGARVDPADP
jgi:hypothetical protein